MAGTRLHCQALPGPQRPAAGKRAASGPVMGPTTLCTNWSWMESSTKSRPAAMQFSPLLKKTELMPCAEGRIALGYDSRGSPPPPAVLTICTALPRSQSAKMRRGDFPPSSRETFFTLLRAQLKGTGGGGLVHGVGDAGHGTWDRGWETWDMGHRTQDIGHGVGDTGHRTWGEGHRTWDGRHRTRDMGHGMGTWDTGHGVGDTGHGTQGGGHGT